jgi:hypothetical protein
LSKHSARAADATIHIIVKSEEFQLKMFHELKHRPFITKTSCYGGFQNIHMKMETITWDAVTPLDNDAKNALTL